MSDISRISNFKAVCIIQNLTLLYSIHCSVCHHDNIQYLYLYNSNTVCVWGWPHMPRLEIQLGKGPESINWAPSQKLQLTFLARPRLSVDLKICIEVLCIKMKGIMLVKRKKGDFSRWKHWTKSTCVRFLTLKTNGYLL